MEDLRSAERAYEILLQHEVNENRSISERTSLFLLGNSIMFIGFAMLVKVSKYMAIVLGVAGLVSCVMAWAALTAAIEALDVWVMGQRQIEEQGGGVFAYMREKHMSPATYGFRAWEKGVGKLWRLFPNTVWVLAAIWIAALVYVIRMG